MATAHTEPGALCIFADAPLPGRVMPRLWPELGQVGAAVLAKAFLMDALRLAFGLKELRVVVATDDLPAMESALGEPEIELWPQGDGAAGERVERVLSRALEEHDFVIVMRADAPGLPAAPLRSAVALLSDSTGPDVVIGPALDGGVYLFGAARAPTRAGWLAKVRLGTEHASEDARRRLERGGLTVREVESWSGDVERAGDMRELAGRLARDAGRAPATAAALRSLGW